MQGVVKVYPLSMRCNFNKKVISLGQILQQNDESDDNLSSDFQWKLGKNKK